MNLKRLILENLNTPEWLDDAMDDLYDDFKINFKITWKNLIMYEIVSEDDSFEMYVFKNYRNLGTQYGYGEPSLEYFTREIKSINKVHNIIEHKGYKHFNVFESNIFGVYLYSKYNTTIIRTSQNNIDKLLT